MADTGSCSAFVPVTHKMGFSTKSLNQLNVADLRLLTLSPGLPYPPSVSVKWGELLCSQKIMEITFPSHCTQGMLQSIFHRACASDFTPATTQFPWIREIWRCFPSFDLPFDPFADITLPMHELLSFERGKQLKINQSSFSFQFCPQCWACLDLTCLYWIKRSISAFRKVWRSRVVSESPGFYLPLLPAAARLFQGSEPWL